MPRTVAIEQRGAHPLPPDTAMVLGAFDGLHLGHQALVARARTLAAHVALVTFDPHPSRVLAPDRAPVLLQTAQQRLRVAGHFGVQRVVLLPFDRETAATAPEAFAHDVLGGGLAPAAIVVGRDFRFGHRRAGTPEQLAAWLPNTPVAVVDPVGVPAAAHAPGHAPASEPGHKLGSTLVRTAVRDGAMERARAMLGRHYAVTGRVVQGDRRGRTIGFPTANIAVDNALLPPAGVYATVLTVWSAEAPDVGAVWASVTNLGQSPTFKADDAPLRLETHVVDRDLGERLYGAQVEVSFVAHLRDEQRFDGIDALVAQIRRDADLARTRVDAQALADTIAPLPPPSPDPAP